MNFILRDNSRRTLNIFHDHLVYSQSCKNSFNSACSTKQMTSWTCIITPKNHSANMTWFEIKLLYFYSAQTFGWRYFEVPRMIIKNLFYCPIFNCVTYVIKVLILIRRFLFEENQIAWLSCSHSCYLTNFGVAPTLLIVTLTIALLFGFLFPFQFSQCLSKTKSGTHISDNELYCS